MNSSNSLLPIAIIGAGPVGLAAAAHLTERKLPFVVLLNKHDLQSLWSVSAEHIAALERAGWTVQMTSARSGEGVEEAFQTLAARVIVPHRAR